MASNTSPGQPAVVLQEPDRHVSYVLVMAILAFVLVTLLCVLAWRITGALSKSGRKRKLSARELECGERTNTMTTTLAGPSGLSYSSLARQIAQNAASWSTGDMAGSSSSGPLQQSPGAAPEQSCDAEPDQCGREAKSAPVEKAARPVPVPRTSVPNHPTPKPRRPDMLPLHGLQPGQPGTSESLKKETAALSSKPRMPFFTPQCAPSGSNLSTPTGARLAHGSVSFSLDTPTKSDEQSLDLGDGRRLTDEDRGSFADQAVCSGTSADTPDESLLQVPPVVQRDEYASYEDMRSPHAAPTASDQDGGAPADDAQPASSAKASTTSGRVSKSQNSLLAALSGRKRSAEASPQHDIVAHLRQSSVTSCTSLPLPDSKQAENARYVPLPIGTSPRTSQQQVLAMHVDAQTVDYHV